MVLYLQRPMVVGLTTWRWIFMIGELDNKVLQRIFTSQFTTMNKIKQSHNKSKLVQSRVCQTTSLGLDLVQTLKPSPLWAALSVLLHCSQAVHPGSTAQPLALSHLPGNMDAKLVRAVGYRCNCPEHRSVEIRWTIYDRLFMNNKCWFEQDHFFTTQRSQVLWALVL